MVLMLFLPIIELVGIDNDIYRFGSMGLARLEGNEWAWQIRALPLFVLVIVIDLLLLLAIFLYKNRRLQMRICVYSIILEFGLIGLGYYYLFHVFREIHIVNYAFQFPVVIPVVCIVLIYLAFRGIRKDEILIRSIDRIR